MLRQKLEDTLGNESECEGDANPDDQIKDKNKETKHLNVISIIEQIRSVQQSVCAVMLKINVCDVDTDEIAFFVFEFLRIFLKITISAVNSEYRYL